MGVVGKLKIETISVCWLSSNYIPFVLNGVTKVRILHLAIFWPKSVDLSLTASKYAICVRNVRSAMVSSSLHFTSTKYMWFEFEWICRARLEHFEQACAVDSVTRKCAGPSSECRLAILGILGTKLRTTCACNGTDVTHVYDCLGWQRILWFNPCVGKFSSIYHHYHHPIFLPHFLIGPNTKCIRNCKFFQHIKTTLIVSHFEAILISPLVPR